MRTRLLYLLTVGILLCGIGLSGCRAGSAYEAMLHDNVIAAAEEALKGVEIFNATVVADAAIRQEGLIKAVSDGIEALAQDQAIDAEQAAVLAASVTDSLRTHLTNYAEQEQRRSVLYEVTVDNLRYIIQISEQGKKFTLYKADIGDQWREYLDSSARTAIGTID